MSKTMIATKQRETARRFPERGPIDDKGREVILSLKNVDVFFGKGENLVKAVQNASFDVYKGETFSLVGESGSGKTTIGRAVIRVNPCTNGEILYKGVRISGKIPRSLDREVIRNIQMIFQDPAASLNERATVDYIISEGLYNFRLYKDEADRVRKVEEIIEEVGLLPEHLTRYPHEFSGGQRQRIGLARAMVMNPEFVVADEPISSLDVSIRAQVLNLMNQFKEERGTTYLFIAHDLSVVRFISDRIAVIYKGRIVEVAGSDELFNFPLHPYTHSLVSAIPIPDPKLEKNKVLFTYDPSSHQYTEDDKPELTYIGHDHYVYGTPEEIEKYKALREKNEFIRAVKIRPDGSDEVTVSAADLEEASSSILESEILERPIHDTGNAWYSVGGFLLPILFLFIGWLFRRKNYIKNYLSCRRGAIVGLILRALILVIFGIAFLLATL